MTPRILLRSILALLLTLTPLAAERAVRDYMPEGFMRQPSFVQNGGMINKNEHAVISYVDALVLPPAVMVGYRYGILYWWDVGVDVGGDYGVFQALFHTKMEMFKTRKSERFFWGVRLQTGYKYHVATFSEDVVFDDVSWITSLETTVSFRFREARDRTLYLTTLFYIDRDLRTPTRQTDYYVAPAILGFEMIFNTYWNFFAEAGWVYSINGMETYKGVLYAGQGFPVVKIGVALRTGDKTAIYYARETREKAALFPAEKTNAH